MNCHEWNRRDYVVALMHAHREIARCGDVSNRKNARKNFRHLIRRYPGAVAHAAREASREQGIPIFEASSPAELCVTVTSAS